MAARDQMRSDKNGAIRVMLVDDHIIVREGLVAMLAEQSGIDVVSEVGDGDEAIAAYGETKPDVVLLDLRMSRIDGFEALEKLKAKHRDLAAIMFSGSAMPQDIDRARKLGASGFLSKDIDCVQLCSAIVKVWKGGQHWPARSEEVPAGRDLSERERQVLEAIRRGLSNADIGRALSISEHTVKSHVKKLLKKLHAADRAEAVARGFEEGLLR